MTGRRPCAFWGCPQNSAHARGVETVALSSEGPLDNGHMRRYTKVARSRAKWCRLNRFFCGVHTWQIKVNLLARFATPKDSTHE